MGKTMEQGNQQVQMIKNSAALQRFVERIERLEEEKSDLGSDIRDIYKEAVGAGLNSKVMRQVIRVRKMDQSEVDEQEALLELYRQALEMR